MVGHKDITTGDIHIAHQWSYADSTARGAATGFVATDVGKLALQEDDNTLWILTATTPTWVAVGGTTSPGGADTQVQFNDGGAFGGDTGMTYDKTNDSLSLLGSTSAYTINHTGGADDRSAGGFTTSPAPGVAVSGAAPEYRLGLFGGNGIYMQYDGSTASSIWGYNNSTSIFAIDQNTQIAGTLLVDENVTLTKSAFLTEQAAAAADVAGDGQIWVKNDTPNTLYFTDDAGTDTKLTKTRTAYVFAKGGTIGTTTLLNNGLDTIPIPYDGVITRIEGFVGTWTLDLSLTADTLNVTVTYGPYGGTSTSGVTTDMGAAGTFGGDKTLTVSQGDILKVATTVTPAGGPDTIANLTIVVVVEH